MTRLGTLPPEMTEQARWREFRLWYGAPPQADNLFSFKKQELLPILDRNQLGYALVLDQREFILVRVEVDSLVEAKVRDELSSASKRTGLFREVTVEEWSPVEDARRRIRDSLHRVQVELPKMPGHSVVGKSAGPGWKIAGRQPGTGAWVLTDDDVDTKVEEFASFMAKVAGRLTLAYIRELPRRIDDRWLQSLFVHLLLDSLSTNQPEEWEVRAFPFI